MNADKRRWEMLAKIVVGQVGSADRHHLYPWNKGLLPLVNIRAGRACGPAGQHVLPYCAAWE